MDITFKIQSIIENNADDFILFLSQYSERSSIKYDFNINTADSYKTLFAIQTFYTIRMHTLKSIPYVVFMKIKKDNKEYYEVCELPIDDTYKSLITEIINAYESSIENNYFS